MLVLNTQHVVTKLTDGSVLLGKNWRPVQRRELDVLLVARECGQLSVTKGLAYGLQGGVEALHLGRCVHVVGHLPIEFPGPFR